MGGGLEISDKPFKMAVFSFELTPTGLLFGTKIIYLASFCLPLKPGVMNSFLGDSGFITVSGKQSSLIGQGQNLFADAGH